MGSLEGAVFGYRSRDEAVTEPAVAAVAAAPVAGTAAGADTADGTLPCY